MNPKCKTFNSQLELVAVRLGGDRRGCVVRRQAHQRAVAGGTMADVSRFETSTQKCQVGNSFYLLMSRFSQVKILHMYLNEKKLNDINLYTKWGI